MVHDQLGHAYQAPTFDGGHVRALEKKLKEALKEEEMFWKKKSRVQWLNE